MEIEIVAEEEVRSKYADRIAAYKIKPPIPFTGGGQHFGIDPGTVNSGVAELSRNGYIYAFQIKVKRNPDAVQRISEFYDILSECLFSFSQPSFGVIEGSSFGDRYRQAELAEIRTSGAFWMKNHGVQGIKFLAPPSIRKMVFGNGKTKAHHVWTNLPSDCAAAISCAYASMFSFGK